MAGGSSLDLSPNHSRNFTADSSTRWTSGRLCFESLESLLCVSTTNTPKQKSLCVHKLRQLQSYNRGLSVILTSLGLRE
ncbi:hypothetical protein NQZ68_004651 [Dissostichus eleginoides]|nr:hypothetical protein NQZ68_004651 [Dissostichus eleginoides]